MAKFCTNCGNQLDENAKFCANCGTAIAGNTPEPAPAVEDVAEVASDEVTVVAEDVQNVEQTQAEPTPATATGSAFMAKVDAFLAKIKLDRVKALIISGAVVGVIVIAIALSVIFPSPKTVVKRFMNGVEDMNAKAIINTMPSFIWDNDKDEKEDAIESLEKTLDYLEVEDLEYTIKKVKSLDDDDIEEYEDSFKALEKYFDEFNADDVKAMKEVKVKVSAEIDGEDASETMTFVLIKYKGQWKILDSGVGLFNQTH